nr:unnamed protein product [Meloidogyne enterolobii]
MVIGGQQKLISAINPQQLNCPPYNSNDTINKQKKQQPTESTDLWISSNGVSFNERVGGQENGRECLEMESSHFGHSNTTSIYGALPIHNPQGNTPSNRRCSMLSYASVKAPTIHSTLAGRCSNANTIIQNQIPASRIFSSSQNQQNNNKNIRSTSPSSLHSPSTTNTSSSGGNGMRENTVDQYNPQYQQPQLQTFLQQSPNHQPLQQQQPSNSLASSSMRSSTLGTPSPSDIEDQQTATSTPRPSMDFGSNQKHQQADNEQNVIYEQNQSSPGVPLQNYLTKTIIAGGPDKHESSSFF